MSYNQFNSNQSSNNSNEEPQPNNNSNNGQLNNGRGSGNPKPAIPDEVGNPNCPICLSRVENRAYTNPCLHEFCYSCIKEWSQSHNKCPVCRTVFQKILYNIRSDRDYDEEEVAEPPDLIAINNFAFLQTPNNSGLYIVNPLANPFTPERSLYLIEYYGPNQLVFLGPLNPNMVIVAPDELEHTLQEMNAHPNHMHGYHPHWLRRHQRHH